MRALVEGILAGYGIAIPVGPITILIFDTALRRGFGAALPAAAGAASADLVYATLAAVAGFTLSSRLAPHAQILRLVGALVLGAIAAYRLWRLLGARTAAVSPAPVRTPARTYAAFLGLTLTNPLTVTYFAALIIGLQGGTLATGPSKVIFVAAAVAASFSWQVALATAGTLLHHRLPERAALVTGIAGNLVIALLALRLAL